MPEILRHVIRPGATHRSRPIRVNLMVEGGRVYGDTIKGRIRRGGDIGSEVRLPRTAQVLGRFSASATKQVMFQKMRETERDNISEFSFRTERPPVSGEFSDVQICGEGAPFHLTAKEFLPKTEKYRSVLEYECSTLRSENKRLLDEVRDLRLLLSKSRNISECGIKSNSVYVGAFDNRAAAAEMLAALDDENESQLVIEILSGDGQPLSELLKKADALRVLRVTSLLASCRAALVYGDQIVPTEFGHRLVNWIMEATR